MSNLKTQIDLASFSPSTAQREAKSAFLVAIREYPLAESYSLAEIQRILPQYPSLTRWWKEEGFKEWFSNSSEFAQAAEQAAWEALQTCREIMRDDSKKETARVNAAKLAIEIAGKINKYPSKSSGDGYIDKMDKDQLAAFIQKYVKLLPAPKE